MDSKLVIEKLLSQSGQVSSELPSPFVAVRALKRTVHLLFPQRGADEFPTSRDKETLARELHAIRDDFVTCLKPLKDRLAKDPSVLSDSFLERLPALRELMLTDAQALFAGDPAAKSIDEVLLSYPGFFATAIHRIAHEFYRDDIPLLPRIFSEYAHQQTGIDIHPGASIGASFCIDHGTGIVIGETAILGSGVKLYQGVTLGALSVDKALSRSKRHPTLEDRVVVYSNATILGGSTTIGHDSVIGGNVWLTESVPPHSTVYHRADVSMRAVDKK